MKPKGLKASIDESARKLMTFLDSNKAERLFDYPFAYSYPSNCCESVSLIFTYLVEEKFDHLDVSLIRGFRPKKHETHFWVKAGDLLYDLTAHQFSRRKPIIGVLAHPFFFTFPDWQIEGGRDFVHREAVIPLYHSGVIPF